MDLFNMFTGTIKIAVIEDMDAREAYEVLARNTVQSPSESFSNVVRFSLPASKSTTHCEAASPVLAKASC